MFSHYFILTLVQTPPRRVFHLQQPPLDFFFFASSSTATVVLVSFIPPPEPKLASGLKSVRPPPTLSAPRMFIRFFGSSFFLVLWCSMTRSDNTRNISFTPAPVFALDPKCWLPTLIAYLQESGHIKQISYLPLGFVQRYLSVGYVAFISSYDDGRVLREIHLKLLDPLGHLAPRLEVSNVVHDQGTYKIWILLSSCMQAVKSSLIWWQDHFRISILSNLLTMSTLIINLIKSMIAFLSGGVPNGELYLLPRPERYCLREATRINRTYLLVVEASPAKAKGQGCLAHASYNQRNDGVIVNRMRRVIRVISGDVLYACDLPSPRTTILKEAEVFSICELINVIIIWLTYL